MPDSIDSLDLRISAEASSAQKSLDRLATSLKNIGSALNSVNGERFRSLSGGISQLSSSMQRFSGSVKTADFTRIATGLNRLSSVDIQGVSNTSRAINTLASNLTELQMIKFDSTGVLNLANSVSQLGRKTVTQAVSNIPAVSSALQELVSGISNIGDVKFDVTGLSQLTSAISKLGSKSASIAANGNITKISDALKQMISTLSTAPKVNQNVIQITQSLAQLATAGGRVSTATKSLNSSLNSIPSSSDKAKKSITSLASAFGKFYATYWVLIRGLGQFKKAIDISSDLTEVQNVVDVTFGDMAYKVEELSNTSIEDFGMSELTAKQISSRFQAMGTSMGFSQEKMSDMSVALTQLAADMASFYNVDQSQIATSLQSIFTGETEPLRRYGLDLSFATVQAWALSQGINADMQSMSQAEKTMLRYQYVMANTSAAQGDFSRTSGSWANQVRILSQNLQNLGAVIGETLINAFKPFVIMMNSAIKQVTTFARTVADALGAIFGWTIETSDGGIVNDYDNVADSTNDISSNLGDATENAKKLRNTILSFDELNVLNDQDISSGSGGGTGGYGDIGDISQTQYNIVKTDSLIEKYKSEIDNLYELGEYVGNSITNALRNINWDSVYEGARNFGKGLADFLNGLISPDLFGEVGKSIARSLNTAIYAVLSFGEEFDWSNLGESIAEGVSDFLIEFDFGSLARAFNRFVEGMVNAVSSFVRNVKWGDVFSSVIEGVLALDPIDVAIAVGTVKLTKFVSAVVLPSAKAQLKTLLTSAIKSLWSSLSSSAIVSGAGLGLALALPIAITLDKKSTDEAQMKLQEFFSEAFPATSKLQEINNELSEMSGYIDDVSGSAEAQGRVIDIWSEKYFELADKQGRTNEENQLLIDYANKLIELVPELNGIIDSNTGEYIGNKDAILEAVEAQKDYLMQMAFASVIDEYAQKLAEASVQLERSKQETKEYEDQLNDLKEIYNSDDWLYFGGTEADRKDKFGYTALEMKEQVDLLTEALNNAKDSQEQLQTTYDNANADLEIAIDTMERYKGVVSSTSDTVDTTGSTILNKTNKTVQGVNDAFQQGFEIKNGRSEIAFKYGKFLQDGLSFGISENSSLPINAITATGKSLLSGIRNLLGINSPSTVMYEIGKYLMQGMGNGISGTQDTALQTAKNFTKQLSAQFGKNQFQFDGIRQGLTESFSAAFNQVKVIWNQFAAEMNSRLNLSMKAVSVYGKQISSARTINLGYIPSFATGGFPEDGFFFANSNELVGGFSNGNTAVANNDQITAGIANAVYPAVYNAMMAAMSNSGGNGMSIRIEADPNSFFRVMQDKARTYTRRTGQSAFE